MYEVSFLKLSERYYKTSPWPVVELIQDVVDQDHVFCLLYKVRTFRNGGRTIHRRDCWVQHGSRMGLHAWRLPMLMRVQNASWQHAQVGARDTGTLTCMVIYRAA